MNSINSYNPKLMPFMEIVDADNGVGYHVNLPHNGYLITLKSGKTKMMYEIKSIDGVKIIFVRYIHYASKKELLTLLAFAVQWWKNAKPSLIYMREKERKNSVGKYLVALGFDKNRIQNKLKPFNCKIDGVPCKCPVYEYTAYNIAGGKTGARR